MDDGVKSLHLMVQILNNIKSNCFLIAYKNGKWNEHVKKYVKMVPEPMLRKKILSILTYYKKRKMLIYELPIESNNDFQQYVKHNLDEIDAAIVSKKEINNKLYSKFFAISEYIISNFEENRLSTAFNGKSFKSDEVDQTAFLNQVFYKALKYSKQIDICDRQMGRSLFTSNYQYTVKIFLGWLKKILYNSCTLISFHIDHPGVKGKHSTVEDHIKNEFKKICMHTKFKNIRIFLYHKTANNILPHNRFIVTDQICLSIERGMDFLNDNNSLCRDVDVNYKDFVLCSDFVRQLDSCNRIQIL